MNKPIFRILTFSLLVTIASASWQVGDGHKMHYPQTPDMNGWSVGAYSFTPVADDWTCSETGPVSNVYLWFSSDQELTAGDLSFSLLISENDSSGTYDKPGSTVWQHDELNPDDGSLYYTVELWDTGNIGEYDSPQDDYNQVYLISIENLPDPFIQQEGSSYWLSLYYYSTVINTGWVTSDQHHGTNALRMNINTQEFEPIYEPGTGGAIDMAFVITPEPCTAILLLTGSAIILRRKRKV